eukprot:COSAG02_NODE_983_length_15470_cov_4.269924_2_plen_59_part_00
MKMSPVEPSRTGTDYCPSVHQAEIREISAFESAVLSLSQSLSGTLNLLCKIWLLISKT